MLPKLRQKLLVIVLAVWREKFQIWLKVWSGRQESNLRPKLGKLLFCH
jgi:hypothetical protein